jgi:hypothetical protein
MSFIIAIAPTAEVLALFGLGVTHGSLVMMMKKLDAIEVARKKGSSAPTADPF